jgi:SagB-type dehydrogenase family enzyme
MKKYAMVFAIFGIIIVVAIVLAISLRTVTPASGPASENAQPAADYSNVNPGSMITLPNPDTRGGMSLTEALSLRRSIRSYGDAPLSLAEVSQLLWSAQGFTNERGFRTAPSAGATFPLEIFLMVNQVEGLKAGIYHYLPADNALEFLRDGAPAADLARACLSQSMISDGGAVLIFAADFERTTGRYGERGIRYVHNEIGHASQNVHLQAAALDLGTVVIGAYRDEEVEEILNLDDALRVLYLMPVGRMP